MKFSSIQFTPSARVTFTNGELKLMTKCSRQHYDAACKAISAPGPDSFLYGWTTRGSTARNVTSGQLDTLMKVVEVGAHLPTTREKRAAFGLGLKLRRVFVRLQECYGRTEEPGITLKD